MADIYVNHTGDNTTGADEATAFNDLQTAINNAVSNDRVCVKIDGTYNTAGAAITFPVAGNYSAGEWIRIEAYLDTPGDCRKGGANFGHRAVFNGGSADNLFVVDRSNIWIENICCTGCNTAFSIGYNSFTYSMIFKNCATLSDVDWAFDDGSYYYNQGVTVDGGFYRSGAKFYCKFNIVKDAVFLSDNNSSAVWTNRTFILNSAIIASYGGSGPASPGYRSPLYTSSEGLFVKNCYLEGRAGITCSASNSYVIEYNNIFNCHENYNPIEYSYGSVVYSDHSATNKSVWGKTGLLTDGSGRLNNINFLEQYEDLENYDFTLKKDSVLRNSGWGGVSGLDQTNDTAKTLYGDLIGPCGLSLIKVPKGGIFTQGG